MPDAARQLDIKSNMSLTGEYLVGLKRPPAIETAMQEGRVPKTSEDRRANLSIMIEHTEAARQRIQEWASKNAVNSPLEILNVYSAIGQILVKGPEAVVKQMEADLEDIVMGTCPNSEIFKKMI
jgi:hypothetical protein